MVLIQAQQFDIFDTPIAKFDYVIDNTLDTVFFNNTSSVVDDTMSFEWQFGDLASSYSISPKHFYATGGSFQVVLIARTANGCFANSESTIILAKPNANFNYTNNACVNSTILFTDLMNGTSYSFTIVATNENGSSSPSIPSVPITPKTSSS